MEPAMHSECTANALANALAKESSTRVEWDGRFRAVPWGGGGAEGKDVKINRDTILATYPR
jgi:hypothetical protein